MPASGRFEVALDVVRQRLERRDVDDLRRVGEAAVEPLPHQVVDRRKERGERLARAGRRGDQRVAPGLDRGPGLGLRGGGRREGFGEPLGHGRVEQGADAVGGGRSRHARFRARRLEQD